MCTYGTDIHDTVLILYGHDQPILVPFDIENNPIVWDKTGIAIDILNICRRLPYGVLDIIIPGLQWLSCIRMLVPKSFKSFSGDNTHDPL